METREIYQNNAKETLHSPQSFFEKAPKIAYMSRVVVVVVKTKEQLYRNVDSHHRLWVNLQIQSCKSFNAKISI
jgi:hypothetical protein